MQRTECNQVGTVAAVIVIEHADDLLIGIGVDPDNAASVGRNFDISGYAGRRDCFLGDGLDTSVSKHRPKRAVAPFEHQRHAAAFGRPDQLLGYAPTDEVYDVAVSTAREPLDFLENLSVVVQVRCSRGKLDGDAMPSICPAAHLAKPTTVTQLGRWASAMTPTKTAVLKADKQMAWPCMRL